MKNLISICLILSTTIAARVSQATLIENYLGKSTESFFHWENQFNFYGTNGSFDGYLKLRQAEGNDFDILLRYGYRTFCQNIDAGRRPDESMPFSLHLNVVELPTKWQSDCTYLPEELFTRRNQNDRIVDLLLIIENHPANYFGQYMQITASRTQISTRTRTFTRQSFRYPFERLPVNIIEGDGMGLRHDLFMPIARWAEKRSLRKKPTEPVRQDAKSTPDRLPMPRRERSYYPRGRGEEQAGRKLVVSRTAASTHLPITHSNGVPGAHIDAPLRYRFPEFYAKQAYYSESNKRALGQNKRRVLPVLALSPNIKQPYIPNLPLGVVSGSALRARNGHSGKIYNINNSAHFIIPSDTPVRSDANDWPTTATRTRKGQTLPGKLARIGSN